jgi:hypothetical protein
MKLTCPMCGRTKVRARSIDNAQIIWVDPEPSVDGELALLGDVDDEPTALWNFTMEDAEFWNLKQMPPLVKQHRCAGTL